MKRGITGILNTISIILLFGMIASCYYIWLNGFATPSVFQLYNNMIHYMPWVAGIVLVLNCYRLRKSDFLFVAVGVLSIPFYNQFNELRQADIYLNLMFPLIIFTVLDFKLVKFGRVARTILAFLILLVLIGTFYRVWTEIPAPPEGQTLWNRKEKVGNLWLNVNTIGASMMTATFLSVSLFKSVGNKWIAYPIYILGIVGVGIVQAEASFVALGFFIFMDVWPEFSKNRMRKLYGIGCTLFLLFIFPIIFILANIGDGSLFTGRARIWLAFYKKFFSNSQYLFVGAPPFTYTDGVKVLGHHDSYNAILGSYGFLGLGLLGGFILLVTWQVIYKKQASSFRYTFLLAFFAVMLQSTMEDSLVAPYWIPLMFSLLGFACNDFTKKVSKQRPAGPVPVEMGQAGSLEGQGAVLEPRGDTRRKRYKH